MILDIMLGIAFCTSATIFCYRFFSILPDAAALPEHMVLQRLHREETRFRLALLHYRTLYRERYHIMVFWNMLGKWVHRLHVFLLRRDNSVMRWLNAVRSKYEQSGGRNGREWNILMAQARRDAAPSASQKVTR